MVTSASTDGAVIPADRLTVSSYCARSTAPAALWSAAQRLGIAGVALTAATPLLLDEARRLVSPASGPVLRCSSVNSAGYFTRGEDHTALLRLGAVVDAPVNVIDGGLPDHRLAPPARERALLRERYLRLLDAADAHGARLSVEPIHPSAVVGKGVLSTLAMVDALLDELPLQVTLDVAHSWWDPDLDDFVAARADRIAVVQVCGLRVADGAVVRSADPRDGAEVVGSLLASLDAAGYTGPLELELFDDLAGPALDDLVTAWATPRATPSIDPPTRGNA